MEAPPPTSCLGALTEYKTVGVVVVVVGIVVVVVPRHDARLEDETVSIPIVDTTKKKK